MHPRWISPCQTAWEKESQLHGLVIMKVNPTGHYEKTNKLQNHSGTGATGWYLMLTVVYMVYKLHEDHKHVRECCRIKNIMVHVCPNKVMNSI